MAWGPRALHHVHPSASGLGASHSADGQSAEASGRAQPAPPRPIDFTVAAGTRVVTVTGPNTGGKTASLKALGLAALMAKAGMFLPVLPAEEGAQAAPTLPWFDQARQ
jgi:DNA mismatch repair protein MutS2